MASPRLMPHEQRFADFMARRQAMHPNATSSRTRQNNGPAGMAYLSASLLAMMSALALGSIAVILLSSLGNFAWCRTFGYVLLAAAGSAVAWGVVRSIQYQRAGKVFRYSRPMTRDA